MLPSFTVTETFICCTLSSVDTDDQEIKILVKLPG